MIFMHKAPQNITFSILTRLSIFTKVLLCLFMLNIICRAFITPFKYFKYYVIKHPDYEQPGIYLIEQVDLMLFIPALFFCTGYDLNSGFMAFTIFCLALNVSFISSLICNLILKRLQLKLSK